MIFSKEGYAWNEISNLGLVRDAGAPVYLINLKPFRYPYLGKSPVTFLHESLGKIVMSVKYLQQGPAADENIKMRSILSHVSTSLVVLLKDFCNFPLVIDVERIIWPLWEAERNNTTRSTNVQALPLHQELFLMWRVGLWLSANVFCQTVMGRFPRTAI